MREMTSKRIFRLSLWALLCLAGSPSVFAQQKTSWTPDQYKEGVHFDRVEVPQQTLHPHKVEVLEFFTYTCPHCYRIYPLIKTWKKRQKEDVIFETVPIFWNQRLQYINLVQVHYLATSLGLDEIHDMIFDWHHGPRRHRKRSKNLRNSELAKMFESQGVDEKTFRKLLNSFGVIADIDRAQALATGYAIRGVPVMIVQGKYKVFPRKGVSLPMMLQVVDYLVERERRKINPVLDEQTRLREGGA